MSLLDTLARIPKILEANLNALIDKAEDPAKMIDQLLIDYKKDLVAVKRDTVQVMADLEVAKRRLDDCDKQIERKNTAAMNALKSGNENDARTIIASKQALEATRASLAQNYEVCKKNADMMKAGYNKLVANIDNLEQRKEAAKAKIALAKAQEQINRTAASVNTSKLTDTFTKYEEQAERALAKANASAELDMNYESATTLTEKYADAGNDVDVDAELEALKASLGL